MKLDLLLIALAVALTAALVPASAGAQTIYRCGNEYTRVACPNGRALEAGDPRSAAQRAEARRLNAQEKHQAAEMEHDRRRSEAQATPALAASLGPAHAVASAATAASAPKKPTQKKKHRRLQAVDDRDSFIAKVPGSAKKKSASP